MTRAEWGPDFMLIGAMKCGTSTLAAQLAAQDGIFVTTPKEPNYFSDDEVYAKGPGWYLSLFDPAPEGALKGEASTHYTKLPDHPETISRMQEAGCAPRLVYVIRDPLERLVSHHVHDWSENKVPGDIEAAVKSHPPLVDYGLYGHQIAPFVEAFGRETVLLSSLERMRADPGRELARVAAHIGHGGPVRWQEARGRENVSAARIRTFPGYRTFVTSGPATALRRALVPEGIRRRIREARQMQDRPKLSPGTTERLEARFLEDRETLALLFPGDPSLKLAYPFAP